MIEFISEDLCTGCNKCVEVCPGDVFEVAEDVKTPQIARQEDCQSCRQCAIHCPSSAVYVTLLSAPLPQLDKAAVIQAGKLSAYAQWLGWKDGQQPPGDRSGDMYVYERQFAEKRGNRLPDPSDRVRRQLYEARERNYI